jgi:hypothetical protein
MYTLPGIVDTSTGLPKPPYRLGVEGFTIGGTIYIPKHFNADKRRFFFFVSQECTGQKVNSSPSSGNMPPALERTGDFSKSFDNSGLIPVIDPTTGVQFPGNVIPKTRINPTGAAVLNFFPLPNFTTSDPHNQNYTAIPVGSHTRRNDVVRGDWYSTPKVNAYFRWINDKDDTSATNHDVTNFVGPPVSHPNPGHGYAGYVTYTISPTFAH